MNDPTKHTPAPTKLRVGLVAAAEEAALLIPAILDRPEFELAAQAGLPQAAAKPELKWFDDRRVMLAQAEVQVVILTGSTRSLVELSRSALERGQHVWRLPPLGRDFSEAIDGVRRAREARSLYRVASWWESVNERVRDAVKKAECAKPPFVELLLGATGPTLASWRSSENDAGGGVLLNEAHPLLEALMALRGLPESVFGVTGVLRRAAGVPRETEDLALALLRYESGQTALIRAAWDMSPFKSQLLLHGQSHTVCLSPDRIQTLDLAGAVVDNQPLPPSHLAGDIALFATALSAGTELPKPTLDRHLAVNALCDSIYLSAKTGQPEVPRRLFEVEKWLTPAM